MRLKRTQMYRRRAVRKLLRRLYEQRHALGGVDVRVYYDPAQIRAAVLWNSNESGLNWINAVAATAAALQSLGYTMRFWEGDTRWEARLFALVTTNDPNDIPPEEYPILP